MAKEKIISCQINYLPINSSKYLEEIENVLDIIKKSGLDYSINSLSTTIMGSSEKVLNLIKEISDEMSSKKCKYTMNILLSNVCGCD